MHIIKLVIPYETYNVAAQSHGKVSCEAPAYIADFDCIGTLRLLEAIRFLAWRQRNRCYRASTRELYRPARKFISSSAHVLGGDLALVGSSIVARAVVANIHSDLAPSGPSIFLSLSIRATPAAPGRRHFLAMLPSRASSLLERRTSRPT